MILQSPLDPKYLSTHYTERLTTVSSMWIIRATYTNLIPFQAQY
jgi:hypothetical protein